jgi:thiol-disulfide isomerase/thioredoxin
MRSKTANLLLSLAFLSSACGPEGDQRPRLESSPAWAEAHVEELEGVRFVANEAPRALLAAQAAEGPVEGASLLFWGDQAAARDEAGYHFAANTEDHEILMFDDELVFLGALSPQGPDGNGLQRPQMIAAGRGARLAAFEASGTVTIFDRWGREFRRLETPFAYAVGAWGPNGLTLSRSPFSVAFSFEAEDPPLLITLDPVNSEESHGFGRVHEAIQPLYIHAANAGTVTVDSEGNIYYAALGRGEVHKYSPNGERLWVSRRAVDFETPEPRLVPNPEGAPRLLLATVQKATAIGPDGLLYMRSAADAEATHDRLDVLDPVNGEWLRSSKLETGSAVLVGSRGAVWETEPGALLAGRERERREFRSFALESFDGGTVALEDLRGKVALVAFWATWCGPCREELPLLDSLNTAVERDDFLVIGIDEDVNEAAARHFAEELGLQMTLLKGRGHMRRRYHYSGLPYSVLIDRQGRVVREYYGFGGREAFDAEVAGRVLAELGSPAEVEMAHEHAGAATAAEHQHRQGNTAIPALAHDHSHGPKREVTGVEMDRLARHLPEARRLQPSASNDVPAEHWEIVLEGLALVDSQSNVFMEEFPGTFALIQLMSLKTQLYVDVERVPTLDDSQEFSESWQDHLDSIEYLLEAYQQLEQQYDQRLDATR